MFDEVRSEIALLSQDFRFIRNLSLTFIMAIASLLVLSDWQAQATRGSIQTQITKFTVEY